MTCRHAVVAERRRIAAAVHLPLPFSSSRRWIEPMERYRRFRSWLSQITVEIGRLGLQAEVAVGKGANRSAREQTHRPSDSAESDSCSALGGQRPKPPVAHSG